MNARTGAIPSTAPGTTPNYSFTFGVYNQITPWTDVRTLSWSELAAALTRHDVGSKEGSCIVPAIFSGGRRTKHEARRIDVVLLDSDAGISMDEISCAIQACGWAAIVSSTYSHMSTRTVAKRSNWRKFVSSAGAVFANPDIAAAAFLREEKRYLPRVAHGAWVAEETDDLVVFEHQPCPKFRVAIPLLQPWRASSYSDQDYANAAWKERIAALAAALHLDHDQACTDTSRLFYLPRRPLDGPAPETGVLEGEPCDIFALPAGKRVARGCTASRTSASMSTQRAARCST